MNTWVADAVKSGLGVFCPHIGCLAELPQSEVKQMTTPEEYEKYLDQTFRLFVLSSPTLGYCPGNCGQVTEKVGPEDPRIVCAVCQHQFKSQEILAEVDCGHLYHKKCFQELIANSQHRPLRCPNCRADVPKRMSRVTEITYGQAKLCEICAKKPRAGPREQNQAR